MGENRKLVRYIDELVLFKERAKIWKSIAYFEEVLSLIQTQLYVHCSSAMAANGVDPSLLNYPCSLCLN